MTWPQIIMLAWVIYSFGYDVHRCMTDKKLSSGVATATVLLAIAFKVAFVFLLHAGGFW